MELTIYFLIGIIVLLLVWVNILTWKYSKLRKEVKQWRKRYIKELKDER